MYYSKFRHLVSEERYNLLAGAEWPSYDNFLDYKESDNKQIYNEMQATLGVEIHNCYKDHRSQQLRELKKTVFRGPMEHVWSAFIPGIIGAWLFFYLGGSATAFAIIAAICFVLNFIYGVALHRWLTHNQFTPRAWARPFLLFLIVLAGFGHVLAWTSMHLIHHKHSDKDRDPHPVSNGFLYTVLMVTNLHPDTKDDPVFRRKLDPDVSFVMKHFWKLHVGSLLAIAIINFKFFLLSFLLIKSVVVLQNGLINYFGHTSKHRPQVANISNWLAFFINGENWHKNHHDDTKRFNQADVGRIDFGYYAVKLFAKNER
jgi:stearoyl-CoA desaturase (delta-9 desaturase)